MVSGFLQTGGGTAAFVREPRMVREYVEAII